MPNILLIHKSNSIYNEIKDVVAPEFTKLDRAQSLEDGLSQFRKKRYELILFDTLTVLSDQRPTVKHFKEAFQPFRKIWPTAGLVALAEKGRIRDAVTAVKAGADDYLTYPVIRVEFSLAHERIEDVYRQEAELEYLRDKFWQQDSKSMAYSASPVMKKLYQNIKSVAPTRSTVLIQGETGVGKGVMARLIHRHSSRCEGPFITIHCGSIPDNLVESELFGHERGSFTGAIKRKLGRFELADKGTIFLDEIGTITPQVQIKLLKVLQEGCFHRVGGESEIAVDVRVIGATNENLLDLCNVGRFRRDLFYRLNVFPLELPPLRKRAEDIPHFINLFLQKLEMNHLRNINTVEPEVIEALKGYDWPGNIRELENIMERAYILEGGSTLSLESFPMEIVENKGSVTTEAFNASLPLSKARALVLESFEKRYLEELLFQTRGRINETARRAGIGTRQLHKMMKRLNLDKNNFK